MMFSVTGSVRSIVLLSTGAFAALLALSACSRDQNHDSVGGADLTVRSLGALNIGSVVATVSGPALFAPKTFPLFARGNADTWGASIDLLPVGSNYVFTVTAVDQSNAVGYAGTAAGITIAKDQVRTVVITAQQTTAGAPFKNAVPIIDTVAVSSVTIVPGATITAKATAHDPNAEDAVTFAWSTSPTTGKFSAPAAATTTWTAPATEGDQTLILTVTDNHGASTSASTVIHVSASNGRGQADVNVHFNTWPQVTTIVAAPGYIVPGSPTSVTVTASDADADVLFYAWTSSCASGSFSVATAQATTFTLPSGATDTSCDIIVAANDGRGGSTTGQLTLSVGKPLIIAPPFITDRVQSGPVVDAGGSANFSVEASDSQGSALSFLWVAAAGVLSNQVDGAGTSQVIWTAPTTPSASFTISVIVSNATGASVQSDFTVSTASGADGGICECTGIGPSGVPVTAACGQSACGSDYMTYSCSASGWSGPGESCGGSTDGGICECTGAGPGNVPVTVSCGQSTCGSDYMTYSCSASGWSGSGESCGGGADGGICECTGAGPGNVPVTVSCGQSTCGSDYMTYSCDVFGWSPIGTACP
jgi:hypothetical protein